MTIYRVDVCCIIDIKCYKNDTMVRVELFYLFRVGNSFYARIPVY